MPEAAPRKPHARPIPDRAASLTADLVALIRAKPVGQADLEATALLALDGIANMLAGRRTDPGRILARWGAGRGADPGRRALIDGGCMHVLEVDDLHRASVVHPGCVVLPAALALARARPVSGPDFLRVVLHGFEAACRVGMSVGKAHYKVWHNTATCGPFGSAMAASAILGLDDTAAVHALGNAGTQSAGLWEFLRTGAMSKHLHAGRAAEAGLVAAELAAAGFTGPPAVLEGGQGLYAGACPDADPGAVLRAPDAPWQVHAVSVKPWPSCRHTHPVLDAALALAGEVDAAAVAEIEAVTYPAAVDVCDRPDPASAYEGKFSLQHCVAVALADGAVSFDSFEAEARARAAGLRGKVRVRAGEPYASAWPGAWGGEVTVVRADGARLTARRPQCKGDPEAALDAAEMAEKARMMLRYAGIDDPGALIDGVGAMAQGGPVPEIPEAQVA